MSAEYIDELRAQLAEKTQTIQTMAMQALAHDVEYENWLKERAELQDELRTISRQNVDLKNRLADLKHEMEMDRWLK